MPALERLWYGGSRWSLLLLPLSWIFGVVTGLRRALYRRGWLAAEHLPVPVIVVGNITVGGTGKTPLLICLAQLLSRRGYAVGIISRGYGGQGARYPLTVDAVTEPQTGGDEPTLIAQSTGLPVVVDPDRPRAARTLMQLHRVNVILSDDGLQHYRLARDYEIAAVDGQRRLGNGRLLPAGPLREPPRRLKRVDCVLVNGGESWEAGFHLRQQPARALHDGRERALAAFRGTPVHALAGIGHPQRFFRQLRDLGLELIAHPYPDHHRFVPADLRFADDYPVLMTEKDAVKCRALQAQLEAGRYWYVPVRAELNDLALKALDDLWRRLPPVAATETAHG
ncbi:MAG: tetraacyldisaccharide 4'-kinase [Nevskiales bacterium]